MNRRPSRYERDELPLLHPALSCSDVIRLRFAVVNKNLLCFGSERALSHVIAHRFYVASRQKLLAPIPKHVTALAPPPTTVTQLRRIKYQLVRHNPFFAARSMHACAAFPDLVFPENLCPVAQGFVASHQSARSLSPGVGVGGGCVNGTDCVMSPPLDNNAANPAESYANVPLFPQLSPHEL